MIVNHTMEGVQKYVAKSFKLPFRSASDNDADDEYTPDGLYEDFLVSEMFSAELDEYDEESKRRVVEQFDFEHHHHHHGHAYGDGGKKDDDNDDDDEDLPPTPGAAAGKQKHYVANNRHSEYDAGAARGDADETSTRDRVKFRRRSFEDNVVTDSLPSEDSGEMSPENIAELVKTHGDCLEPTPSPEEQDNKTPALVKRSVSAPCPPPALSAEGRPYDIQAHSRSEGYVRPRQNSGRYRAVTQHDEIVLIARKLRELGDDIQRQYDEQIHAAQVKEPSYLVHWQKLTICMQSVADAIDATLTWVEHHSMKVMKNVKEMKQQEGILRGLTLLTDISQRVSSIAVVQMACRYLDAPDEAFEAQRDAIRNSLEQVEKEIDSISDKVEMASDLLHQIIQVCDSVENRREVFKITLQFDNAVREANVAIQSCDIRLERANNNIKSLLFKINSVRWFHRGVRGVGFGLTAYYFYGKYCDGSINKATAFLSGGCSLIAWLAMFPTKTYEYYEQLNRLQHKHEEMREQLTILRKKLTSAKDHKRNVTGTK